MINLIVLHGGCIYMCCWYVLNTKMEEEERVLIKLMKIWVQCIFHSRNKNWITLALCIFILPSILAGKSVINSIGVVRDFSPRDFSGSCEFFFKFKCQFFIQVSKLLPMIGVIGNILSLFGCCGIFNFEKK